MIIDAFLYFNEENMLRARLEYLNDHVDIFFIVESRFSFTGEVKGYQLPEMLKSLPKAVQKKVKLHKVDQYLQSEKLSEYTFLPKNIHTWLLDLGNSLDHSEKQKTVWINDFYQREAMRNVTRYASENDIIFFSDIDEIFYFDAINKVDLKYFNYLSLRYFKFSINFEQNKNWQYSFACGKSKLVDNSINHIRSQRHSGESNIITGAGCHFTSFGSSEIFLAKLKNWGHQEYNTIVARMLASFRFKRGLDPFENGEILEYTETNIPSKLDRIMQKYFANDFKKPSKTDIAVHKFGVYFDKTVRRMIQYRDKARKFISNDSNADSIKK